MTVNGNQVTAGISEFTLDDVARELIRCCCRSPIWMTPNAGYCELPHHSRGFDGPWQEYFFTIDDGVCFVPTSTKIMAIRRGLLRIPVSALRSIAKGWKRRKVKNPLVTGTDSHMHDGIAKDVCQKQFEVSFDKSLHLAS